MAGSGRLIGGRYRLTLQLGAGGMGRVWLADDEMLYRHVAIKEVALPYGFAADEREVLREWTLREAQAAARVCHANVIRIFDVVHSEDRPWIVMEYVSARSLLDLIVESGPLPVDRVADIGLAVLSALDAARRAGVLHHDVKPSNVLIADDGRVVLTDFGSAVTDDAADASTATGRVLGSPNYVAPERFTRGASTARADLWSLGATLYHAVEGRAPYARESTAATLWALAHRPPDPVRLAGPLAPVLDGLLQRDPDLRMTPREVAYRLRRLAPARSRSGAPPGDRTPHVVGRAPVRAVPARPALTARRRRRMRAPALAAVLVVMAALTVPVAAGDGVPRSWVTGGGQPPTAAASSAASSAPAAFVLPQGFIWRDNGGFRVAVPRSWRHHRERTGAVLFSAPDGGPTLRISAWTTGAADPVTAFVDGERTAGLAAYRRIRIEALPRPPEAIWEYTFRDPWSGPVRGLRRVMAHDGSPYLIEWRTPAAAWAENRQVLAVVLESFGPLRGA